MDYLVRYNAAYSGQTMRVLTSSQLICFLLYLCMTVLCKFILVRHFDGTLHESCVYL